MKAQHINRSPRAGWPLALVLLVLSLLPNVLLLAQCDTLPVSTFWSTARVDGTGIDFTSATPGGSPAQIIGSADFAAEALKLQLILWGDDGQPKFYFDGEFLYDATTLAKLAGGQSLGRYSAGVNAGISYYQPLMLYLPNNENLVYIFYGMAFSARFPQFDLDMPAWLAVYDVSADQFVVRDSVLHGRATESWFTVRHPDEQSWWLVTRQHSPSSIMTYKLDASGVHLVQNSLGGPTEGGLEAADVGGIAISSTGNYLASIKENSKNRGPFDGETWLWDFDCQTGICSNATMVVDNNAHGGQPSFSADGHYLYFGQYPNRSDTIFPLARVAILGSAANLGPLEQVPGGDLYYGMQRGPDQRLYTGPANQRDALNGYVDYPGRWLSHAANANGSKGALIRPGGTEYIGIPTVSRFAGLVLPTIPVDLPELRTPHLRGPNVVDCGAELPYQLVENCYQELALVTATAGPGVTILNRAGREVTLRFDTTASLPQVRYVALANAHSCRTYRDTMWMFVEGTCAVTPTCTAAVVGAATTVSACDSTRIFGQWRSSSGTYRDTLLGAARGGCDSVAVVELTLGQSVTTTSSVSICAGGTVTIHGQPETQAADYTQRFTSRSGCDSISTVTLTVSSLAVGNTTSVSACDSTRLFGQWRSQLRHLPRHAARRRPRWLRLGGGGRAHAGAVGGPPAGASASVRVARRPYTGSPETQAADYTQRFTSRSGCDSVSTVTLTVETDIETTADVTACDSALVFGQWRLASDEYQQSFTSIGGCDSTHTVRLTIEQLPEALLAALQRLPTDTTSGPGGAATTRSQRYRQPAATALQLAAAAGREL